MNADPPRSSSTPASALDDKEARLAAALRANLRRRKQVAPTNSEAVPKPAAGASGA